MCEDKWVCIKEDIWGCIFTLLAQTATKRSTRKSAPFSMLRAFSAHSTYENMPLCRKNAICIQNPFRKKLAERFLCQDTLTYCVLDKIEYPNKQIDHPCPKGGLFSIYAPQKALPKCFSSTHQSANRGAFISPSLSPLKEPNQPLGTRGFGRFTMY